MSDVRLEVQDGIAVATIDRAERLNACRRATYEELRDIAARLDREPDWRALVLTGAGRAFCAGQDLGEVAEGRLDAAELARAIGLLQDITRNLAQASKPTVAAINGLAIGFGLECTLAFDLRIATDAAWFMLPELKHGLFHTNGTYHYLARLVGPGLATDMILTGRRVDAEQALRAGLVSRIVPAEKLLANAMEIADQLARLDPTALALAREGLRSMGAMSLAESLDFEARACETLLSRKPHG